MIEYTQGGDLAVYNGLKYRRDKHTGYYLNAKTHKRLHVAVYENEVGAIPEGYHVHHIDFNKDNNDPSNLVALTNSEHETLHGQNLTEERKERMRENLIENARPKASEWHGSDEGRKWHAEHGKEAWTNRTEAEYICDFCGAAFKTLNRYSATQNHFCSNKCRAAFRRASGVDDVTKICERCGHEYRANKYQQTKYCPDCKGHRR